MSRHKSTMQKHQSKGILGNGGSDYFVKFFRKYSAELNKYKLLWQFLCGVPMRAWCWPFLCKISKILPLPGYHLNTGRTHKCVWDVYNKSDGTLYNNNQRLLTITCSKHSIGLHTNVFVSSFSAFVPWVRFLSLCLYCERAIR